MKGNKKSSVDTVEQLRLNQARNDHATAYVCEQYVCEAPTTDPEELRVLLNAD